ncbi:DoxX family protein [Adhaeribacter sp. BT258]|uniref:DoxX family protein n=1 Tax=Adhaeribacter terrigena TaxID=2793070 RepID=A0ABS1C2H6_9BACT|nr:DoxX family protein [Adhaeribacter terrigena]MBK0402770.1 DoxX family protein [Adhaeribacter terrigena]
MNGILGKYRPHLYAILRIVSGLLFAMHGTQKLLGWPGEKPVVELASLMGLAGVIELVAGLMIAIGFLTSWAAFISSGEMAVAYFMAHAAENFWPILNNGELAILYCFLFLYIAASGSGIWSLNDVFRTKTDHQTSLT